MSELKQRITDEVKSAMRSHSKQRLATLRLITAALKQKEVDDRVELDDPLVLGILDKLARQHRDAIEQFRQARRQDLVDKENSQLQVVLEFLPQPLTNAEITALVGTAITETGASGTKDMGRVMGILKPRLQGRADMGQVSAEVKKLLA